MTVSLLMLICQLAKVRRDLDDLERAKMRVPMRFDLAGWDITLTIEQWLVSAMTHRFTSLTRDQAVAVLREELVLPVLDGLDEMGPSTGEPSEHRQRSPG